MHRKINGLMKTICLLIFSLFLFWSKSAFGGGIIPPRQNPNKLEYVKGEVLVKFRDDVKPKVIKTDKQIIKTGISQVDAILQKYQVTEMEKVFKTAQKRKVAKTIKTHKGETIEVQQLFNIYKLKFAKDTDAKKVAEDFEKNPDIEYAEPNYIAHICEIPNDPSFSTQWGLHNTGQFHLEDADIDAPEAWDVETGDSTIIIGIIDTGVDWGHPDLADKMVSTGYDFVNNDNDAMDDNGHGSHVAGIAAATTNNTTGIAGVAWKCKILPVKVMQSDGTGSYSDIAAGVIYAANNGAKIINLSLGGYAESYTLRIALENAYTSAVIVASAGNDGTSAPHYPAAWSFVIGVGASGVFYDQQTQTWYEGVAKFSNRGLNADLYAPGVNIYSTIPLFHPHSYSYTSWNGTSMAAPFVSGTVALLRSHFPDWSNDLIHGQIINTTDPIVGGVRLNAYNALTTGSEPQLSLYSHTMVDTLAGDDRDGIPDAGETIEMLFDIQNTWGWAYNVQATLRPHSYEDTSFVTILDSTASFGSVSPYAHVTNESNPFLFSLKSSTPNNMDIYFDYEITCDGGYRFAGTFYITAQRGLEVSGIISENTTWSNDYLYIVTGNVLVEEGVTLTIEPGTRIQFCPEKYLRIDGCLIAIGTEDSMIVFTSNAQNPAPGDWGGGYICGGIHFTSSSVDAEFDEHGNYISGSIIKYAEIEFGGYIDIVDSSPYIAYNFIHDNCGAEHGGGITLAFSSTSRVEHNLIRNNSGRGGGIFLFYCSAPVIAYNLIEDNFGSEGGGISEWASYQPIITHNIIRGNSGGGGLGAVGIAITDANATITYNTLYNNGNLEIRHGSCGGIIQNNTIMYNWDGIMPELFGSTYYSFATVDSNNIIGNIAHRYAIYMNQPEGKNINAQHNYWGTTNTDSIDAWIWDYYDDFNLGKVNYQPFETTPITTAPGFLCQVQLNPPSPIGCQVDTFTLIFSKPMDISIQPQVSFGVCDPYTQHTIEGDWADSTHWQGTYAFNIMTGDGINRLRVTTAEDCEGMEIPKDTRFSFVINAAGASSEGFIAQAGDGRVDLSWHKPEMVDLMGYNMYRYNQLTDTTFSDTVLVNTSMITDTTYTDYKVENGVTYFYMYTAISTDFNESAYSKPASATPVTGIEYLMSQIAKEYYLKQNYPNPFNSTTTIIYGLPKSSHVDIRIYDLLGREVTTLVNDNQEAKHYKIIWNGKDRFGSDVSSGIYFYRIVAKSRNSVFTDTKKLLLLR